MTRINLVPVTELADQHLVAEYRELPRMNAALAKALFSRKSKAALLRAIPSSFVLGTGHMMFFMDKGQFLKKRHTDLVVEMRRRGFAVNFPHLDLCWFEVNGLMNDYKPTQAEVALSRSRITEKLTIKPGFYTWSVK